MRLNRNALKRDGDTRQARQADERTTLFHMEKERKKAYQQNALTAKSNTLIDLYKF